MSAPRPMSVGIILAAAGMAAGCSNTQGVAAKAPRPVRVQAVATSSLESAIRYSATIEPFEQVSLAFKTSGYVDTLLRRPGADGRLRTAQPGDGITKGTVLASIPQTDSREREAQGRARLSEAEAALKKARLDLERAKYLFAADSLTKTDLDAAEAAFDGAEARSAAARAEIELALSAIRDCTLLAPASGILLERRIEIGSLVSPGMPAFVLGDVSSVKARFGIPDAMIGSVKQGDRIGVVVEAVATTTFQGLVTAIAPGADPQSRVFDVEVTIPNADGRLRPGMIGTVAVERTEAARLAVALTVPLTAVVKSTAADGSYAVVVVERQGTSEVAKIRRVVLGDVRGNGVVVLDGIKAGDRIIVSGASLIVDGEVVRVVSSGA